MKDKLIVRLSRSYWRDKRGLYSKTSLVKLKRLSEGYSCLLEDAAEIGAEEVFPNIINIGDCEDGIYEACVVNISRDWETNQAEDWDYKLIPIESIK